MAISLKRVYEAPSRSDGRRILVERLWPRGLGKEAAKVDLWAREAAPSTELRRWFGHDPSRWPEFRRHYFAELEEHPGVLDPILALARAGNVTFVFASKEVRFNNAVALREAVEARL